MKQKRNKHKVIVIQHNSGRSPRRFFANAITKGIRGALVVTLATLAIVSVAYAGSLTPSAAPAATMHSLADVAGSGFATATHSLKALFDSIHGAYDSASVTANADGSVMERLQFIQQNLPGGFSFGSADSDNVLTSAGGTYSAANLTSANVKLNVAFGTGSGSQTGTFSGSGNFVYGDDDPSKVLTTASSTGTWDASNLTASVVQLGTTFATSTTGSLTPDGGTASTTDLFTGKTAHLSADWTLDTGTLDLACNTSTFDGTANLVATAYDGAGDGTNRWCVTESGDAVAGDITSGKIAWVDGISITGTLSSANLANMFNGSISGFAGGSQANGGGDDYNNGGAAPSDTYKATWTACNAGNSYCGTGLSSADAKDENTGLIWSLPCNGSGCASFSDSSAITYTWDSSGGNNNSQTASQLCSAGSHGDSGWSLPHQKQLMQAYVDGSYGNLEAAGVNRSHWSQTTYSPSTSNAWYVSLSHGNTNVTSKTSSLYVRCVRSA